MKHKKTLSAALAALTLLGAAAVPALAAEDGKTAVPDDFPTADYVDQLAKDVEGQTDEDGLPLAIAPAPASAGACPVEIDGETTGIEAVIAVPLRAVAEKLGFTVTWNPGGSITVDNGAVSGDMTVGEDLYCVAGSPGDTPSMTAPFSLGMAPCVVHGTTYVPAELFNALLGAEDAVSLQEGAVAIRTQPDAAPASPYIPCATMEEAAKLAGFSLTVPGSPDVIEAWEGNMIQAIYGAENETMRIRKAPGGDDISGDYTAYPQVETVDGVTLKGENNSFSLAIWAKDGYTYSVSVAKALSQGELLKLVAAVK